MQKSPDGTCQLAQEMPDAQRWIISALSVSCDNTQADRLRLKERETITHFFDGYVIHVIVVLNVFPQSTVDNSVTHRNTLAILSYL